MLQPRESSPIQIRIYMHACISRISISQARLEVNLEHPSECRVHMPACSIGSYSYIYIHIYDQAWPPNVHITQVHQVLITNTYAYCLTTDIEIAATSLTASCTWNAEAFIHKLFGQKASHLQASYHSQILLELESKSEYGSNILSVNFIQIWHTYILSQQNIFINNQQTTSP